MRYAAALGLVALLATGCSQAPMNHRPPSEAALARNQAAPASGALARPVSDQAPAQERAGGEATGGDPIVASRMLVATADLVMIADEPKVAVAATKKIADELGGYLQWSSGNEIRIRVPTKHFDAALEAVAALGTVASRKIEVQDVTDAYQDLDVRIANAKAMLAHLRNLLDRATDVEKAMKVERELARVMTELERLELARKNLANRAALATISVHFKPRPAVYRPPELHVALPFDWLHRLGVEPLLDFPKQ